MSTAACRHQKATLPGPATLLCSRNSAGSRLSSWDVGLRGSEGQCPQGPHSWHSCSCRCRPPPSWLPSDRPSNYHISRGLWLKITPSAGLFSILVWSSRLCGYHVEWASLLWAPHAVPASWERPRLALRIPSPVLPLPGLEFRLPGLHPGGCWVQTSAARSTADARSTGKDKP